MDKDQTNQKSVKRILFPFSMKLALIVTLILVGSLWIITTLMAVMVGTEFVRIAEDTNFAVNSRAASGMENRLYRIRSEALMLLDMSSVAGEDISIAWQLRNIFFDRNPDIAAVIIPGGEEIINRHFLENNELGERSLAEWLSGESAFIERAKMNEPVLRNVSPTLGINLLALFYPWQSTGLEEAAVIFFSPQSLAEITGAGSSSTFLVNGEGDILIHPDFSQVFSGANIYDSPYFEALRNEPEEAVRLSFARDGNRYAAAGHRISFTDAAVFSTMEYSLVTEQTIAISRRNLMLSVTVMFLAILVTWFFAKSITNPVKKLIRAAGRIEQGDFDLELKPKSRDELGVLTERFTAMGHGLRHWEAVRDLAGRYNSREITGRFLRNEMELGGENLQAVILSVDFIPFNTIAGKLKPGEALRLLNTFVSKVIECIEKTGGVVDKIIGSRVLAFWGAPLPSRDFDADVMNSLRAALMMRNLFWKINSDLKKTDTLGLFRMGCGIHLGEVLAGKVGASKYNKYTFIGENVNRAISCGISCSTVNADIIISKPVRDMAGGRILAEELKLPPPFRNDISIFGLVNFTPAQGQEKQSWPFTMGDVRDLLGGRKTAQTFKEES